MCISTEIIGKSVSCESLPKKVCDIYEEGKDPSGYIPDTTITDKPCLFNGPSDSMSLQCVSARSISWNNCSEIKMNEVVIYEEEEKKFCDDAAILLKFPFLCYWLASSERVKKSGSCGCVYYLISNGLEYFYIIYIYIYITYVYSFIDASYGSGTVDECRSLTLGCQFDQIMVLLIFYFI
jgi:hypothetical protein